MYRIAVTNRHLCRGIFLDKIEELARGTKYDAIMLREKDLPEREYQILAKQVQKICRENEKRCILHQYWEIALAMGHPWIHLPLPILSGLTKRERSFFEEIGSSVHSVGQAAQAEELGATYVVAGHIFSTDCKRGVPPRGLDFLGEICDRASVPVYGIGGITEENEKEVTGAGAEGVCVMSGCML